MITIRTEQDGHYIILGRGALSTPETTYEIQRYDTAAGSVWNIQQQGETYSTTDTLREAKGLIADWNR